MPALAHEVATFVLTELSSRYEALPKDSRVGRIVKGLEGPATRFAGSKLGKTTITTADRILTVADGAVDYAMSTKTYALAERIVLDTVIPTAAATVSTVSHQATAVATSASVTHCLVVSRCYVARDAGLRQVNRGRTTARNASLAARDGVSRTMSSAKAGASCALTTVRTAPARVSEAIYQAAVTTRANVNASIARAVNISKAAMDAAFARYAAVRAAVIGRYKGSRDYTVAIYSSARSRTVSTINSAASSAAERCARLHAYVAGFLSTVTERLSALHIQAGEAFIAGKVESAALVLRKIDNIKTLSAPLISYIRMRFAMAPGFFASGSLLASSVSLASSAAQEAVEENPSEEPAAPAHMEAPVQEASQPKAHDKRKKKKSNNKSSKNFGGETSAERTVLGVRNVIADYEERLNAF